MNYKIAQVVMLPPSHLDFFSKFYCWMSHVQFYDAVNVAPDDLAGKAFFNIITLLNVVEHLDQPRLQFSQIYRLLKPGGVLLLTCPYGSRTIAGSHLLIFGFPIYKV